MKNPFSSTHRTKKTRMLLSLLTIFLSIGIAAAAVFTIYYTSNTATVKTPDIRLVAGPDSGGTTYPGANVTVASTHDYATVSLSLFPSATNTPQPATYYTNLLQITNVGTSSHNIISIVVTSLTDAANLGNITIYYYADQTDTPTTGTPIGSGILISTSTAPVPVFSGTHPLAASGTNYIEIVGYANSGAAVDSTVSFTVAIQWS